MRAYRRLWIALALMALLSPVGVYFPRLLGSGAAWGEWGMDELRQMLGYAPARMEKTAGVWKAPMPDYALPGQEQAPISRLSLAYVASALIGIAGCGGGTYLLVRVLTRKKA